MADKKNNTGIENTGENNSGNRNSGHGNSGHRNSGDWNSGYGNSGDWNSGYGNSGCFNTNEPKARMFNRECPHTLSELRSRSDWPDLSDMNPCVWVESSIMTDEEKKSNPTHETTGGYIKKLSYKDAWAVFWRKTSDTNKKKVLALPNFDAAIFQEITGIDVEENSGAKKKAQELEDEAQKLLDKAKELRRSL